MALPAKLNIRGSSLALVVAMLVLVIGGLAATALWVLSHMPHSEAHEEAARRVTRQGLDLTRYVAALPMLRTTNTASMAWRVLPMLVDGLHSAQPGLQYVEISRDGVTVFHRQAGPGRAPPSLPPLPALATRAGTATAVRMPPQMPFLSTGAPSTGSPVRVSRQVVERHGEQIPVMVFRQDLPRPDGSVLAVEVGLRRAALSEEEAAARQAARLMFRLAFVTILCAFAACLVVLIWTVRRDWQREQRRRQEEHLAFSGMLANGIVHDFRNPMSSVRLDAQMLVREAHRPEGSRPERMAELAGRISRTLERMDKVFKEFLYLSKPSADSPDVMDLRPAVAECLETLAPRMEQAGVTAAFNGGDGPLLVKAEPAALRRALLNVLLNAVQFAPAGSQVKVTAEAAGDRLVLEVLDAGPGIPASERRRVFDMFTTSRPGGTGLGLFLAKTAIVNAGGAIEALPADGGGTRMRIVLPAADVPETETPCPSNC